MTGWQPIETAPKDGTAVLLKFPKGKAWTRQGEGRRLELEERIHVGSWWDAARVEKQLGKKKARTGARGSLIASKGGYWGGAGNSSQPMAGHPIEWMQHTVHS